MIRGVTHSSGNRVAAVYLARAAEGTEVFRRFVNSYRAYAAGLPHSLVIIFKGFQQAHDLNQARAVFAGLPHLGIELDDSGFDIGAYLKTAAGIDHDYVCFLNSFTEIAADGWLALLHYHASMPDVGLAGAMGSYESLLDSYGLITKVSWLCNVMSIAYDPRLEYFYDFIVNQHCGPWKAKSPSKFPLANLPGVRHALDLLFRRYWWAMTRPGKPLSEFAGFPPFPNPHIRSNGFMISRQRLLQADFRPIETKLQACGFESGPNSLTARIRRQGFAAVIVDRNGDGYDVEDWYRSGTFRLGDQSNLILTDNQSRKLAHMSAGERATHVRVTWGDYLEPAPSNFPDLGFEFAIDRRVVDPARRPRTTSLRTLAEKQQLMIEQLKVKRRAEYENYMQLASLLETKDKQIQEILDSFCWRCTRPIRVVGTFGRRLKRAILQLQ